MGVLRLKERGYLPTDEAKILSATVSERAGRWFVSLQVEMVLPDPDPTEKPAAGVDLGIKALVMVSDGMTIENPRALKSSLRKIKRLQRDLSRRQKDSANRSKAIQQLAKAHLRVANMRSNALHQATSLLTKTKSAVVLEDLKVRGMLRNHSLAQAIADVGWYEFRRQMRYKGGRYGCQVYLADRFYPSTKRCSGCGNVKAEIGLDDRIYKCDVCGQVMDRDLNAALNLEQLITASSAGMRTRCVRDACGEGVSPGIPAILDEAGTEHQSTLV